MRIFLPLPWPTNVKCWCVVGSIRHSRLTIVTITKKAPCFHHFFEEAGCFLGRVGCESYRTFSVD
ncbi:hypothetical protein EVA_11015 [gut metagenome]|uniref:Uncharacterized protein n=1 Tax=gut metagenome TaxID=749906 RepID=J9GM42_9ZZZZ